MACMRFGAVLRLHGLVLGCFGLAAGIHIKVPSTVLVVPATSKEPKSHPGYTPGRMDRELKTPWRSTRQPSHPERGHRSPPMLFFLHSQAQHHLRQHGVRDEPPLPGGGRERPRVLPPEGAAALQLCRPQLQVPAPLPLPRLPRRTSGSVQGLRVTRPRAAGGGLGSKLLQQPGSRTRTGPSRRDAR